MRSNVTSVKETHLSNIEFGHGNGFFFFGTYLLAAQI